MQYDLVFEDGGAKGIVFVGAVLELNADEYTYDCLLGTSAGAITTALMSAGYGHDEMLEAITEQEDGKPVFASFEFDMSDDRREALVAEGS